MKRVIFAATLLAVMCMMAPAYANYLIVTQIGEGTVSPSVGSHYYVWYSRVTLTATPAPGWVFDRWEGDFEGKPNPYTFRSTSDKWGVRVFKPATPGLSEKCPGRVRRGKRSQFQLHHC